MTPVENKVWYLKKSRLFSDATDRVVRECEHFFTQVMYNRRNVIFEQGEPGRLVYLVKSGRVRIARATAAGEDLTVALLGPGDLFGEEVTFRDIVRCTFAVCVRTRCCAWQTAATSSDSSHGIRHWPSTSRATWASSAIKHSPSPKISRS
jgi:hypothetical protein